MAIGIYNIPKNNISKKGGRDLFSVTFLLEKECFQNNMSSHTYRMHMDEFRYLGGAMCFSL